MTRRIARDLSTAEGKAFWASAQRIADQARGWPASRLALLDAPGRLSALMDRLADHASAVSDEQLLEDAAVEGTDPMAEAERVRHVLRGGLSRAREGRDIDRHEFAALLRRANPGADIQVARTMDRVWCDDLMYTLGRTIDGTCRVWVEEPAPWKSEKGFV